MMIQGVQLFWYFVVGTAFFMFGVLDGFDMGVGMLVPFYSKNKDAKSMAIATIWPVWDGNELWGLIGGGALFALFPKVFTGILEGMYPFVILLLVALMYRPVAFEVIYHNPNTQSRWHRVLGLASFGIAFLTGTVIGNLVWGFNLGPNGLVVGGLLSLLRPYALLTGLLFVGQFLVHGAVWLLLKLDGDAQADAAGALKKLRFLPLVLSTGWVVWTAISIPGASSVLFWIPAALLLVDGVLVMVLGAKPTSSGSQLLLAVLSVANQLLWWLSLAAVQFPVLIRSRVPGVANIDLTNAGSSIPTLSFLAKVVPVVLVFVIGYTIYVYGVFKGKTKNAPPSEGGIGY